MAQAGFEPAASFVLSDGGLPVAYRAVHSFFRLCPEQESNLHTLGFKSSRSAIGVPGRDDLLRIDPGWTRTIVAWV